MFQIDGPTHRQVLVSRARDQNYFSFCFSQFLNDGSISVDSVLLKVTNVDVETASSAENVAAAAAAKKKIIVSWTYQDEDLGSFLLKLLKSHYQ